MSGNSRAIEMPKLLKYTGKSQMKWINEQLLINTGCFAFLRDQVELNYRIPSTYYEAFWIYSIALYVMYHDFGCEYLDFILDNANAPDNTFERRLQKCRNHKRNISTIFRVNLTHGVYDQKTRDEFRDIISKFYLHSATMKDWDSYINDLTESQWEIIVKKIIQDANRLVDTIEQWAIAWGKKTEQEREILRLTFVDSDKFYNSVNKRVCKSLVKDEYGQKPDLNFARIEIWRGVIRKEFRKNDLCTPLDILNRVQELIHEVNNPIPISSVRTAENSGYNISLLKV